MSNPTSNFGWQMPTPTDLVTDLPADFEVFGQAVDTSLADLKGGTTGQILSKTTNADMDFTWIANDQGDITEITATSPLTGGGTSGAITVGIQASSTTQSGAVQLTDSTSSTSTTTAATPNSVKSAYDLANAAVPKSLVDAKADLITATADNTPARLAVGANETRLVADSVQATGLKYVADTTNYAINAKGDLLAGTAADTLTALTVGANNTVLTADSSTATGLKWATAGGGGKVLQVVSTTSTSTVTNSTNTYADSNLSLSITPTLSTSKVLILTAQAYAKAPGNQYSGVRTQLVRGATQIAQISENAGYVNSSSYGVLNISYNYLDSPATTTATTYKVRFSNSTNAASVAVSDNGIETASMILMEIGA